jgi:hypothetical protein
VIGILPDENNYFETVTSTNVRFAQEIIPPNHEKDLRKVAWIGVFSDSEDEIRCIEIWSGYGGLSGELRDKLKTIYSYELKEEGEELTNYIFKVPQGIFYNGLSENDVFYLVVPYTGKNVDWCSINIDSGRTLYYSGTTWSIVSSNIDLCYVLYSHHLEGDSLTNLEEYIVCTDPKDRNSDVGYLGYNDDVLTDGQEVRSYFGGGGESTGEGEVLARITVEEGAINIDRLLSGAYLSSHKIFYNEDPLSDDYVEYSYIDNGTEYEYTTWECVNVFKLRDGSEVTQVTEGNDEYLVVWDTPYLDQEEVTVEDQTTTVHCEFVRFIRVQEISATYTIDLSFRCQDIYFSEPCSYDSDWDGILDGAEIAWNGNSDGSYTGRELTELGTDSVYNVRDRDSDNDEIDDGDEIEWNETNYGQGLDELDSRANMIDPDSDGDSVWDGWEREPLSDYDHDGFANMEDPDSDSDGLCDGWVNDYVWDPQAESGLGKFVHVTESTTFSFSTSNSSFDWWEGEDADRGGMRELTETDPLDVDTDNDQFWDGFDVKDINGDYTRGEMYIRGGYISGYDYQRTYFTEQSSSTDPLDPDSDGDGIEDGMEYHAWGNYKYMEIKVPTGQGIVMAEYYDVRSDPSINDTDNDGLKDDEEYEAGTLPNATDSDRDGILDDKEVITGTNPKDCDTDGDGIPDGFVDGWWFDTYEKKWFLNVSRVDTEENYWEGEDRNCNGISQSSLNETDPTSSDSDDDGIEDPFEYFFNLQYEWTDPETDYDVDGVGMINPLDEDSDGDGLLDGEEDYDHDGELDAVVGTSSDNPYFSSAQECNPYCSDSDGDGVEDGDDSPYETMDLIWRGDSDQDGLINAMDSNSDGDDWSDDVDQRPLVYGAEGDTDGDQDPDNDDDGILDCNEDTNGNGYYDEGDDTSNLNSNDTDLDGLLDMVEFVLGTNLTNVDTDGDGLTDSEENTIGTDPKVPDSDHDGVRDGTEVIDWKTNPLKKDSDGDGLEDNDTYERNMDTDGDGIKNALDIDSDNDGLTDGNETKLHQTDPVNNDTDSDGLLDGQELLFYSNPRMNDTDYDLLLDNDEYLSGTDPSKNDTDGDKTLDRWDVEPTVSDLRLTLNVYEMNALEEVDVWPWQEPEFRLTVKFEQLVPWTWEKLNNDGDSTWYVDNYNIQEDKAFITDKISPKALWIKVSIVLDEIDSLKNDRCDISPQTDRTSVTLYYDLRTSLWNDLGAFKHEEDCQVPPGTEEFVQYEDLEEYKFQEGSARYEGEYGIFEMDDDIGYITGKYDRANKNNDDCDISFGIHLNDRDRDNITDYAERMYWGTDRSDWDSDGDKMSDGWEIVHVRSAVNNSNGGKDRTTTNDPDSDGISDLNEYELERFGAHPRRKDIFVEVDWMVEEYWVSSVNEGNPGGDNSYLYTKPYKMKSRAQFLVIKPFAKHNIGLHIDDGCMGGGKPVDYEKYLVSGQVDPKHPDYLDRLDIKWGIGWDSGADGKPGTGDSGESNGILDDSEKPHLAMNNFDINRWHVFHYVVFCDKIWFDWGSGFKDDWRGLGETPGDEFMISTNQEKYTFMHELGHNLNLHHPINKNGSYYYSDYNTKSEAKKTVMYAPSSSATGGYTYDKLWKYIDLTKFTTNLD